MSDDSALVTGTQGTFGNEQPSETTQKALNDERGQEAVLKAGAKEVLAIIDSEMSMVHDFRAYMSKLPDSPDGQKIQDEFRARQLYTDFLNHLKNLVQGADDGEQPE